MAPAAKGLDDLDLDGNWAAGGDSGDEDGVAAKAVAGDPAKKKKLKKRKLASASAAADPPATKRARKNQRKKATAVGDAPFLPCARVEAAWAAEAKAASLTPLDVKEVVPRPEWFLSCPLDTRVAQLPQAVELGALARKGGAAAGSISVLVLCSSTDRVFEAVQEVQGPWGTKPLALAAHGGGRKKDQVARQAKEIAQGAPAAVGTPGRVLRLLEEGHLDAEGIEAIVVDLKQDRKDRDVLTQADTRRDFFGLLRRFLAQRLGSATGPRLVLCGGRGE